VAAPRERIVILDDEADFRTLIAEYLSHQGYTVRMVANAAALDACLAAEAADLILLDLSLPDESGLSVARRLKASGSTPIIILTGAGDAIDRIVSLEIGADDYLTKPFDLRELQARIGAILRRTATAAEPSAIRGEHRKRRLVSFGRVALDLDAPCLVTPEGRELPLTASEHRLLAAFARHPHHILSRDQLLELGSDGSNDPYDRSIDSRVKRIRRKVEANPEKPQVIKTVRSRGYIFVPPEAS
jgi:DNA-binding response OmpR family regulator